MLSDFIRTERERFETRHNNMFAFAFSDISRYLGFLQIILARSKHAGDAFIANTQALQSSLGQKGGPLTPDQLALLNQGGDLGLSLQLEIESFYLFAKILLDEVARAVEFYFGQVHLKNSSLDSHDDLTKNLKRYAEHQGLSLSPSLLQMANRLKASVSDFRDYQIAHHKNPRTIRGTSWGAEGNPRMILIPIASDHAAYSWLRVREGTVSCHPCTV